MWEFPWSITQGLLCDDLVQNVQNRALFSLTVAFCARNSQFAKAIAQGAKRLAPQVLSHKPADGERPTVRGASSRAPLAPASLLVGNPSSRMGVCHFCTRSSHGPMKGALGENVWASVRGGSE